MPRSPSLRQNLRKPLLCRDGVTPFQNLVKSHLVLIEKFPNRKPGIPDEAGLTAHD